MLILPLEGCSMLFEGIKFIPSVTARGAIARFTERL